jgi:nicotinamide riboside kinase
MAAGTEATPPASARRLNRYRPRRVALLGAESTGKSSLAEELAARLGGIVVAEYLREFCDRAGRVPRMEEQAGIAAEQDRRERFAVDAAAERGVGWVVCDTTSLMVALYSVDCFEDHSLLPGAIERQRGYAATLVCLPDIDWVADGFMRMDPNTRDRVHRHLVGLLDAHRIPWRPVSGTGEARIRSALDALEGLA